MTKTKLIFLSNLLLFFSCTEEKIIYYEPTKKTEQIISTFNKSYIDYFEIDYLVHKDEEFDYWFEFEPIKEDSNTCVKISHIKKSSVYNFANITGYSKVDTNKIYIIGKSDERFFKKTDLQNSLKEVFVSNYKYKAEHYDPPYLILTFDNSGKLISSKPTKNNF